MIVPYKQTLSVEQKIYVLFLLSIHTDSNFLKIFLLYIPYDQNFGSLNIYKTGTHSRKIIVIGHWLLCVGWILKQRKNQSNQTLYVCFYVKSFPSTLSLSIIQYRACVGTRVHKAEMVYILSLLIYIKKPNKENEII